jgi:hypothetical protein
MKFNVKIPFKFAFSNKPGGVKYMKIGNTINIENEKTYKDLLEIGYIEPFEKKFKSIDEHKLVIAEQNKKKKRKNKNVSQK